jgi:hypothetical protein
MENSILKPRIMAILRGRPGLGDFIPGYNICCYLERIGCNIKYISYGSGKCFLENSNASNATYLSLNDNFSDWPGLSLYPHGVNPTFAL